MYKCVCEYANMCVLALSDSGPCAYNVLHDQAQPVVLSTLHAVISRQQSDHKGTASEFCSVSLMSTTHTPTSAHHTSIQLHILVVGICSMSIV